MSYMGLFWETGRPEAWALSRKSGDKPEANLTGGNRLDAGMMAQMWSQTTLDEGVRPVISDPANGLPEAGAERPAPKPDDGTTG